MKNIFQVPTAILFNIISYSNAVTDINLLFFGHIETQKSFYSAGLIGREREVNVCQLTDSCTRLYRER